MFCPGQAKFSDAKLSKGYMTLVGKSNIYKCPGKGVNCVSELPVEYSNQCSAGSGGVACAECMQDYKWDTVDGMCVKCESTGFSLMFIFAALVVAFLVFRLIPRSADFSENQLVDTVRFVILAVPVYQMLDCIQVATIFGMSTIPWPDQISSLYRRVGGLVDIKLYSLECQMEADRAAYAASYLVLLNLMPLVFFGVILLLCVPSALVRSIRRFAPSPILGINMVFAVTSTFYMMIFNFSLNMTWQTYKHPAYPGSDAEASLTSFPFLLTSTNTVTGMRLFSIFAIAVWGILLVLIPVAIIWVLPKKRNMLMMRRCTLSLVLKYDDKKSWWCLIELASKTFVVMTLTIFTDPAWQVQFLALIMVPHLFAQSFVKPYRFLFHDISETALLFGKVCLLGCSIPFFADAVEGEVPGTGEPLIVLGCVCFFCFAIFCWGVFNMCRDGVQLKGGGAAQLNKVKDVLVVIFPPRRPGHGLVSLAPGSEQLKRIDEVGTSRDKAARSAGLAEKQEKLENERKQTVSVLSLKVKQDCVVWTLAEHYGRGTPAEKGCGSMKKCQQELLARGFPAAGNAAPGGGAAQPGTDGFDKKAFDVYMKDRKEIMESLRNL